MRNPFRKKSPEEEFVEGFLKGMKESSGFNQDAKVAHALIKTEFDKGEYVSAQRLVNEYTRATAAALRDQTTR